MMPLQFDIRAILRAKAPNAKVPDFIIRYLERIVHVKEMNAFLRKYPDKRDYEFIRLTISEELGCSASIDGIENIPTDGRPLIFVSNHPLGGLDGMIIAQMIHDQIVNRQSSNRQLKVIVNDLLMFMEPIAGLWAPVNKVGHLSREQAAQPENEPDATDAPQPPATVRTTASKPRATTATPTRTEPAVTTADDGVLRFKKSDARNPGFDANTIAWPEVNTNTALDPNFYMSYMYGGIAYLDAMCIDGLGWTKNAEWTDSEIRYTSRTGQLVIIRPDYIVVMVHDDEVPYYYNLESGVRAIISDNSQEHCFDVSLGLLYEVKALLWELDGYDSEYNS